MNSDRILVALLVVVAVVAAIPQLAFAPWGIALVVLGLVAGAMGQSGNVMDRVVIYLAAIALPVFSNSLDVIPSRQDIVTDIHQTCSR